MWAPYQYGHGRLKLVKDLKTGPINLRVSLIDSEEFDDLDKIYKDRKCYYQIQKQPLTQPIAIEEDLPEETVAHLSYKEKVQIHRRRLQNQKLEDKYNNLFRKTEKKRLQMRKPVLYKLLQNFEETFKHEQHLKVTADLKESEKNLELIKINANRRAQFKAHPPSNLGQHRPRFLSLENGLPEKGSRPFPRWEDYVQGRFVRPENDKKNIDVGHLTENIEDYISTSCSQKNRSHTAILRQGSFTRDSLSPTRRRRTPRHEEAEQRSTHTEQVRDQRLLEVGQACDRCGPSSSEKIGQEMRRTVQPQQNFLLTRAVKSKSAHGKRNYKKSDTTSITVASRTFTRSENCSKSVIETMSNFYHSKSAKKSDYEKMVQFLKSDRPMTSSIRRKNYKVIGQEQIKGVRQYRSLSQQERMQIKEQNYEFYMGLLRGMEHHLAEQLPLSSKIIDRIRIILQSNYFIQDHHLSAIAQPTSKMPKDDRSDWLLEQCRVYALVQRK